MDLLSAGTEPPLDSTHTDMPILRRFGTIKASLQKEGMPIADADILIASATLEKAEKLITGNTKHFDRIRGQLRGHLALWRGSDELRIFPDAN